VAFARAYALALGTDRRRQSHRGPSHAATLEHGESPWPAVCLVVSGALRNTSLTEGSPTTTGSAARATTRRGGVRQGGEAARSRLPGGRATTGSRVRAIERVRVPAADANRADARLSRDSRPRSLAQAGSRPMPGLVADVLASFRRRSSITGANGPGVERVNTRSRARRSGVIASCAVSRGRV
jgi:hypothetical protein